MPTNPEGQGLRVPPTWWGEIPSDLLAAVRLGEINLLVGAGVSMDVGLPGWKAMLQAIAASLPGEQRSDVERIIAEDRLLDSSELLRRYLTPQQVCQSLRECLGHPEPGPLHVAVWRLHPRAVLTTNRDRLLEHAYASEARQAPQIRRGLDVDPPDARSEGVLFKLHGDLDDPATLVLSRNDYQASPKVFMGGGISAVFAHRPTLALGYSLRDPDLQLILHGVHANANHLAQSFLLVVPEQSRAELDLLKTAGSNVTVLQYPRTLRQREALLALLDCLATEREKHRFVAQQTPGAIALSKYIELEASKACHRLRNLFTVALNSMQVEKRDPRPAGVHEVHAMITSAIEESLDLTSRTQRALLAASERNQPATWSACKAALQPILEAPDLAEVSVSLSAPDGISLPLGPHLFGLMLEILLKRAVNESARAAQPSIRLSAVSTGGESRQLVVTVTDNGSGIETPFALHAFEPGLTTSGERQFNGLFLVRSIVEECGGNLSLSSELGKGTQIVIRLPFVAAPAPGRLMAAQPCLHAKSDNASDIVVVDDDPALASDISASLEAEGYSVDSFSDPRASVESILARERPPAVVICDIVMPGVSGSRLAEAVRERFPALSFIFMSGYISHPFYGSESDLFMTKPVDRTTLMKWVSRLTRRELRYPG